MLSTEIIINRGLQVLIGLLLILTLVSIIAIAWHLLLPVSSHWFTEVQYKGAVGLLAMLILSLALAKIAAVYEVW